MGRTTRKAAIALLAVGALLVGACGDGDDTSGEANGDPSEEATDGATDGAGDSGDDAGQAAGGGGGSVTLEGETVSFDRSRCFLEEQESAGQTIELTGQGFGTNADGEQVSIDVTRFAEDSALPGDAVDVTVGDPASPDSTSFGTIADIGTVELDGSTLRAEGIELQTDDLATVTASFEIAC